MLQIYFMKREVLKHENKEIAEYSGESTQKKMD